MPQFSKTSLERLATCHPDLQAIFKEVVEHADCSILCGHRKRQEQQQAFEEGKSQVKWPDSKHNKIPSMAVDAAPYFDELRNTDWKDALAFAKFAGLVEMATNFLLAEGVISHRIRWGGDWDMDGRSLDQKFNDLPHFELVKVEWQ